MEFHFQGGNQIQFALENGFYTDGISFIVLQKQNSIPPHQNKMGVKQNFW